MLSKASYYLGSTKYGPRAYANEPITKNRLG
jgi:hypothetical protein